MGWSSWNTYRVHISDSLIVRQAKAMVSTGLKAKGYQFINVDDGYFGHRDAQGFMQPHPTRFPKGMKAVADSIHALGLKAGLYSDAGRVTCGSIWDKDSIGIGAGLYGHEEIDAEQYFRNWGYDFIKIDYCGATQELDLPEEPRYRAIKQAIDKVAGRPIDINVCRWAYPGTWVTDVATSWRISGDIAPKWGSVMTIINKNRFLSAYAKNGHYNDMDMLEIGRGLTPDEEQTHFGMWCIMSSPLLIGCDLTTIPASSLALLKNERLIALNQDSLALQPEVVWRKGEAYVFAKDFRQRNGNTRVTAFYNATNKPFTFSVPLSTFCLAGKTKLTDIVSGKKLRATSDSIIATVAPHATLFLQLEAKQRLEPTHYEAEWAFLPLFDDLGKRSKPVSYQDVEGASGGAVIKNVGGSKENLARWNEVYSKEGGNYRIDIRYYPRKDSQLHLHVNGQPVSLSGSVQTQGQPQTISATIKLRPGNNTIEMNSPYTWTPDIDCFDLTKM